jgi:hypothetical protein
MGKQTKSSRNQTGGSMNTSVVNLYTKLYNPEDPDYASLDQGRTSTKLRHEAAARIWKGGSLLDLGCGSGLILESLIPSPYYYTGVDVISVNSSRLIERLNKLQIKNFSYVVREPYFTSLIFEAQSREFDSIFAIGIAGYDYLSSTNAIMNLAKELINNSKCSGIMTIPIKTNDPEGFAVGQDLDEVQEFVPYLKALNLDCDIEFRKTKDNGQEYALTWIKP